MDTQSNQSPAAEDVAVLQFGEPGPVAFVPADQVEALRDAIAANNRIYLAAWSEVDVDD